jgi:hypothetical protein
MTNRILAFILFIGYSKVMSQPICSCDTIREYSQIKFVDSLKYQNTSFSFKVKKYLSCKDTILIFGSFQNLSIYPVYIADKLIYSKSIKQWYINSILRTEPSEHHYSDSFTRYEPNEIFEWEKKIAIADIEELEISLEFSYKLNTLKECHDYIYSHNESKEVLKVKGLANDFVHCGLNVLDVFNIKINEESCIVKVSYIETY